MCEDTVYRKRKKIQKRNEKGSLYILAQVFKVRCGKSHCRQFVWNFNRERERSRSEESDTKTVRERKNDE